MSVRPTLTLALPLNTLQLDRAPHPVAAAGGLRAVPGDPHRFGGSNCTTITFDFRFPDAFFTLL